MRYECPKCQSQLKFWREFVYDKVRLVNKRTGGLNKNVSKTQGVELDTCGLKCTNNTCDFSHYANESLDGFDHLDDVYRGEEG